MRDRIIPKNNLDQTQSDLGKLPPTVRLLIFSLLNNQSLCFTNTSCSLFYNESSNLMDERKSKQVLSVILDNLEKKIAEVEADLNAVNATITFKEGYGYLFLAQKGGNDVARIDYKLHMLVPKIREHMLAVIFLSTLFKKQNIKITDEFYTKLENVRTRFDNKLGAITSNELTKIETQVEKEIKNSSKGKEKQDEPRSKPESKCNVM